MANVKIDDWVIIDDELVGQVWWVHSVRSGIIDVAISWGGNGAITQSIRTAHHKVKKITKEVADIMRGV
jgi:hypothetical protein